MERIRYIVSQLYPDESISWAAVNRINKPIEASTEKKLYVEIKKYSNPNDVANELGEFPNN